MADALDPVADTYVGIWTDWSKGPIWGLTWTLPPTRATVLTNSLTLFIAFSGIQLWAIIRYALHQFCPKPTSQVRTPHLNKEQIILRNAGSDLATGWLMLNLGWSSRRSTGKRSLRSYAIGITAITYAVLIMTAGIFSSQAISAGTINGNPPTLSRSRYCGVWNETYREIVESGAFSSMEELDLYVQHIGKVAHNVQLSLEYSQACYLPESHTADTYLSSTCNTLKVPRLEWASRDGNCPFSRQMCLDEPNVLVLDTGDIDSHEHLGINSNPKDRLKYRRVTTCAVLNTTGRITGWDGSSIDDADNTSPSKETAFARFGPSLYKQTDWTYSYTNFASFYDNFTAQVMSPYQLDVEHAWAPADPAWSLSDFKPDPDIAQDDADLTLFFLSFPGMYLGQVNDPWFSAHRQQQFENPLPFLQNRYARDDPISTMGCTEQHSFCTHGGICTGLSGFDQMQNVDEFNLALTPRQNATFDRMLRAVAASSIFTTVENLVTNNVPLIACNMTMSGKSGAVISPALPDEQWKIELGYWHSIAMAQLQRTIAQWATGQVAPTFQDESETQFILAPSEAQDRWFCDNFILPSQNFESFSLMSILLIIISGVLVIVCGLNIEALGRLCRKCMRRSVVRRDWKWDDMLLLAEDEKETTKQSPEKDISCESSLFDPSDTGNLTDEKRSRHLSIRRKSSQALPRPIRFLHEIPPRSQRVERASKRHSRISLIVSELGTHTVNQEIRGPRDNIPGRKKPTPLNLPPRYTRHPLFIEHPEKEASDGDSGSWI